MKKYDVFGLGNSLMDVQAFVDEKTLSKLDIKKGIMTLIDDVKSKEILDAISESKPNSLPGGSNANVTRAIAMLGGSPVYTGVVSDDLYGRLYVSKISESGVKSLIKKKNTGMTGTSVILTTSDAERTMLTNLGICRDYSKQDIDTNILNESKIFHTSGYKWDTPSQKEAVEFAMDYANKNDITVSFDIADPFCIQRNVDDFKMIISKYVDILFGNKEEVKILTGIDDPVEAGKAIRKMGAKIVLVKVGGEGSYLFYEDKIVKIDIYKAEKVLDSTGCGDTYAGGFLYGYSKGYPLEKCAKIASYVASRIIGVAGVNFNALDFSKIKDFINKI
ncbi:MAG TPA: adenosine kinase [Spirochaetota bacterium]|nr:adenosine kinase [Spirochaetota bacterium]